MRVLVTGGRTYDAREALWKALEAIHEATPISVVMHGNAKGADYLAGVWARIAGVKVETYSPDWNTHGRAAGPIRNREMLTFGKPDLVVACPGGKGTAHMVSLAEQAGLRIIHVSSSPQP